MGKGEKMEGIVCVNVTKRESFNLNAVIRLQYVHSYDSMVLFPNIFFIDILSVFVT